MPIYEYACRDCRHEFEILHKVGEGRKRKCPECGGRLEKLVSRTSFQLRGGGWYDQGYSKSDGAAKTAAKADGAKSGEKKAGKADGAKKAPKAGKD